MKHILTQVMSHYHLNSSDLHLHTHTHTLQCMHTHLHKLLSYIKDLGVLCKWVQESFNHREELSGFSWRSCFLELQFQSWLLGVSLSLCLSLGMSVSPSVSPAVRQSDSLTALPLEENAHNVKHSAISWRCRNSKQRLQNVLQTFQYQLI